MSKFINYNPPTAQEETGWVLTPEALRGPLLVLSGPERDPRGHVNSVSFYARIDPETPHSGQTDFDDALTPTWYNPVSVLDKKLLVLGHDLIVARFLNVFMVYKLA